MHTLVVHVLASEHAVWPPSLSSEHGPTRMAATQQPAGASFRNLSGLTWAAVWQLYPEPPAHSHSLACLPNIAASAPHHADRMREPQTAASNQQAAADTPSQGTLATAALHACPQTASTAWMSDSSHVTRQARSRSPPQQPAPRCPPRHRRRANRRSSWDACSPASPRAPRGAWATPRPSSPPRVPAPQARLRGRGRPPKGRWRLRA